MDLPQYQLGQPNVKFHDVSDVSMSHLGSTMMVKHRNAI